MAESPPGPANSPGDAGFIDQLRLFLFSLAGYFQARLELAGLESREAALHYLKLAACLAAACFGLVFGYLFFIAGIVMVIAHFSGWPLMWVMLGAALLHVIFALASAAIAWLLFNVPQFQATLAEFTNDRDWCRK